MCKYVFDRFYMCVCTFCFHLSCWLWNSKTWTYINFFSSNVVRITECTCFFSSPSYICLLPLCLFEMQQGTKNIFTHINLKILFFTQHFFMYNKYCIAHNYYLDIRREKGFLFYRQRCCYCCCYYHQNWLHRVSRTLLLLCNYFG